MHSVHMRCGRLKRAAIVGATSVLLLASAKPGWADYKIEAGDTLGFAVAGLPELTVKAQVDIDGAVTLPLVGSLPVAGLSASQILAKVQGLLPGKEYRRRTDDGREFPIIISPGEISLSISEYRPVYLNGDVAKPGEEPYRPGLTVRKAIALVGGFDVLRFKMDNPFLQLSDLTGEYNSLWIDYSKQQAAVARLQAEIAGEQQLDTKAMISSPLAPSLSKDILDNERSQLAVRNADFAKEQGYLREAFLKESERARVLSEVQNKEQDGLRNDTADLQRYSDLFSKGAVALPGLSEARRTVLQAATRVLNTTALLDSVEREEQDLNRRLDRAGDTRRMQLLTEAQAAVTEQAATRAKLQAVSDKLRYAGMVRSQLVRGVDSQPTITIIRFVDGKQVRLASDVDAELLPGDTVDVALEIGEPAAADR